MSNVRIGRLTVESGAGQTAEASERQARRIAELLGQALADGGADISRERIVLEVPTRGSLSNERTARLAAQQLKRQLG
jgi:hypothetical protein